MEGASAALPEVCDRSDAAVDRGIREVPEAQHELGWVGVRRRPVATHGLHADRARASCLDYRLPIQAVGWLRNGVKASSEAVQLNLGGVSSERTDERLAPHCVDAAHSTQMAVEAP